MNNEILVGCYNNRGFGQALSILVTPIYNVSLVQM